MVLKVIFIRFVMEPIIRVIVGDFVVLAPQVVLKQALQEVLRVRMVQVCI